MTDETAVLNLLQAIRADQIIMQAGPAALKAKIDSLPDVRVLRESRNAPSAR